MQNKQKWLIGGGALAVVAIVGLAVGLNQGNLFKGALTLSPVATSVNYTTEYASSGQNANHALMNVTGVDGKDYNLFIDQNAVNNSTVSVDQTDPKDPLLVIDSQALSDLGYGQNLYLKLAEVPSKTPTAVTEVPSTPSAYLTRTKSKPAATLAPAQMGQAAQMEKSQTMGAPAQLEQAQMEKSQVQAAPMQMQEAQMQQAQTQAAPMQMNSVNTVNAKQSQILTPTRSVQVKEAPVTSTNVITKSALPLAHAAGNQLSFAMDANQIVKMTSLSALTDGNYDVSITKNAALFANLKLKIVNAPKKIACSPSDQLTFRPSTLIYDPASSDAANVQQSNSLLLYNGSTQVSFKTLCPADYSKLNLPAEIAGFNVSIKDGATEISQANVVFSKSLDTQSFALFKDLLTVSYPTTAGLTSFKFAHDFSKLNDAGLSTGKTYTVEVRGISVKPVDAIKALTPVANPKLATAQPINPSQPVVINKTLTPAQQAQVIQYDINPAIIASYNLTTKDAVKPAAPEVPKTTTDTTKDTTTKDTTTPPTVINNYYTTTTTTTQTPTTSTKSTEPCVVADNKFYEVGGPNSASCKQLQSLVVKDSATGAAKETIIKSDVALTDNEYRLTTALVTARTLEAEFTPKVANISTTFYNNYKDSTSIKGMSAEELSNIKGVVAKGYLKGFVDQNGGKELAPLQNVSKIELLTIMRQAMENVEGKKFTVDLNQLSPSLRDTYAKDKGIEWIAVTYSWANSAGLITSSEDTLPELLAPATRTYLIQTVATFQDWLEANKTTLK